MDDFRRAWEERFKQLEAYLRRLRERSEQPPPSKNGHHPGGTDPPRK